MRTVVAFLLCVTLVQAAPQKGPPSLPIPMHEGDVGTLGTVRIFAIIDDNHAVVRRVEKDSDVPQREFVNTGQHAIVTTPTDNVWLGDYCQLTTDGPMTTTKSRYTLQVFKVTEQKKYRGMKMVVLEPTKWPPEKQQKRN
jgi:hypothetical protein